MWVTESQVLTQYTPRSVGAVLCLLIHVYKVSTDGDSVTHSEVLYFPTLDLIHSLGLYRQYLVCPPWPLCLGTSESLDAWEICAS